MDQLISIQVEGMTCSNCALSITKSLEKKGAKNVSANAASGEVNFVIQEDAKAMTFFEIIESIGYTVKEQEQSIGDKDVFFDKQIGLVVSLLCTIPLLLHMFIHIPILHNVYFQLALASIVMVVGTFKLGLSAYNSLKNGIPNMDVLIMIGAYAAYIYSVIGCFFLSVVQQDYLFFETAASIISLVLLGKYLEYKTVKATTVAIDDILKLQPPTAHLILVDSIGKESIQEVERKFIHKDDLVLVNAGAAIPVDGKISFGEGWVDEKMISGESAPVLKKIGDTVIGGTILLDGPIKIKATAIGKNSVLQSIIKMIREAQAIKPPLQKLADKISIVFVPIVLAIALITFAGTYFYVHNFTEAIMRSIAVLVISCPCAMGLATPAAIAVGLGRAARMGILIKGGDTLERLKTIKQIVFDKTGTITTGQMKVDSFHCEGITAVAFKNIVHHLEASSSHPIAKSIVQQWAKGDDITWAVINECKGQGMEGKDDHGNIWKLGAAKWLYQESMPAGQDLYLTCNDLYRGSIKLIDELRSDAKETLQLLKQKGYTLILLSGDRKEKCEELAAQLPFDQVLYEQNPQMKSQFLKEQNSHMPTAMVGDGINDAPALAMADVGISLSDASHIAMQSAAIIISSNQLSSLPQAIALGNYTQQTIVQNLFWAMFYNVIAIPVAAFGYLEPTWGAGIMALSDVVLILNSLRLNYRKL
jgi:Cu+-exporting ATPase